ncbi:HYC_CC_PP family protein [Flavobacterium xinjiangense]|uniref:Uncharacterized protein n=1 Tax=Flavobacterium xinjiangense TaxID=178356 RepID=A0A1M7DP50_9FLAO|nr:hypothetical protein [Flavobacterium xinjiangense]SHL81281.1 hypothetical protein SAMN05216269_101180 [Flavobacterium xinjiangense]
MSIKKCTSLFLAFLLLVSNVGLAFNVHYCGKEIASVSLNTVSQSTEKGCCEKIVAKKDSCCKDKVVNFQKKSDNATIKAFSFNPQFPFLIQQWQTIVFSSNENFKNNQTAPYFCDANAPPLFKLYSQYIFYA